MTNATRTLIERLDTFNDDALFTFQWTDRRGRIQSRTGYIFDARDCRLQPGVFLMQKSACLKAHYTEADRALTQRLTTEVPVRDGDVVEFNGELFTVKINGDYSDAGMLLPIAK